MPVLSRKRPVYSPSGLKPPLRVWPPRVARAPMGPPASSGAVHLWHLAKEVPAAPTVRTWVARLIRAQVVSLPVRGSILHTWNPARGSGGLRTRPAQLIRLMLALPPPRGSIRRSWAVKEELAPPPEVRTWPAKLIRASGLPPLGRGQSWRVRAAAMPLRSVTARLIRIETNLDSRGRIIQTVLLRTEPSAGRSAPARLVRGKDYPLARGQVWRFARLTVLVLPTPAERVWPVEYEARVLAVVVGNRTWPIAGESRVAAVAHEDRALPIARENRVVVVSD